MAFQFEGSKFNRSLLLDPRGRSAHGLAPQFPAILHQDSRRIRAFGEFAGGSGTTEVPRAYRVLVQVKSMAILDACRRRFARS